MNNLITFVGFKGSGKDTAANYLAQHYGFKKISFADNLKDAVAAIFCWPRHLLTGDTEESREWREIVDPWWAEKLGIPDFTPRFAMQFVGTELFRNHFHPDVWILNVERRLQLETGSIAISDARFPNEIWLTQGLGGMTIRVKRGPDPAWFEQVLDAHAKGQYITLDVHRSEWAWIGCHVDHTIVNDGTLDELYEKVEACLKSGSVD